VRFLVDANLSPRLISLLVEAGHEATHVFDLGLGQASDEIMMARAHAEQRVVVTADTDFVTMLALTGTSLPSVVLVPGDRPTDAPAGVASHGERGPARS